MSRPGPVIVGIGAVLFLIGAIGGPMLGEDAGFPMWVVTWGGIALVVIGVVVWLVGGRRARL